MRGLWRLETRLTHGWASPNYDLYGIDHQPLGAAMSDPASQNHTRDGSDFSDQLSQDVTFDGYASEDDEERTLLAPRFVLSTRSCMELCSARRSITSYSADKTNI